jgi:hypothetical protein
MTPSELILFRYCHRLQNTVLDEFMPGGAIRTVTIALWPNIIEDHCGNGDTNQNANWSQTHIGTESADDDQR